MSTPPSLLVLLLCLAGAATVAEDLCIGDSIAFGSGADKRDEQSHPKVLNGLAKATVLNAGVNGSTLRSTLTTCIHMPTVQP